jgi:DNA-binding transcriptional regulator YhcF (GntR family)
MERKIFIAPDSPVPKYQQIIDHFLILQEKGHLKPGQQIPSIAGFAKSQKLALATVAKAYDRMKEMGLLESRQGKGFYVTPKAEGTAINVFVLFDTMNTYKEVLFENLRKRLPSDVTIDLHFYHYNFDVFQQLIKKSLGRYSHYVILPHFNRELDEVLDSVPVDKLILLDKLPRGTKTDVKGVFHYFEKTVFEALCDAIPLLEKYDALDVILDTEHGIYIPEELLKGIERFRAAYPLRGKMYGHYQDKLLKKSRSYLIFSDNDMVNFIKHCKKKGWIIGKEIGLIGYDDTPIKEILLDGITVISTDFAAMGSTAAKLILGEARGILENPSGLIIRKTL